MENIFNTPTPTTEGLKYKYGEEVFNKAIEWIEVRNKIYIKKGMKTQVNNYYIDYVCGQVIENKK